MFFVSSVKKVGKMENKRNALTRVLIVLFCSMFGISDIMARGGGGGFHGGGGRGGGGRGGFHGGGGRGGRSAGRGGASRGRGSNAATRGRGGRNQRGGNRGRGDRGRGNRGRGGRGNWGGRGHYWGGGWGWGLGWGLALGTAWWMSSWPMWYAQAPVETLAYDDGKLQDMQDQLDELSQQINNAPSDQIETLQKRTDFLEDRINEALEYRRNNPAAGA